MLQVVAVEYTRFSARGEKSPRGDDEIVGILSRARFRAPSDGGKPLNFPGAEPTHHEAAELVPFSSRLEEELGQWSEVALEDTIHRRKDRGKHVAGNRRGIAATQRGDVDEIRNAEVGGRVGCRDLLRVVCR